MDDERFNRGLSIACCCLSLALDDLEIAEKKTESNDTLKKIQEIMRHVESCVLILESLQKYRALAGVKVDTLH
ncbi:hypothetical protein ACOXVJ_24600 [Pseudomonas knackmussii]|uniref:hypothetical protein n=1 Tax=Pseudomonas knackmussii TaxID=65741 RepID=UPI0012EC4528|nr:hypothetical protein [Pseudomonas knackmussii]